MKRILGNMILAGMALLMWSCAKDVLEVPEPVESGDGLITLNLKNGSFLGTRAKTDLLDYEEAISHLDIVIFQSDADGKPSEKVFHVRKTAAEIKAAEVNGGRIILGKKTDYDAAYTYWVYVIANHFDYDSEQDTVKDSENLFTVKENPDNNPYVNSFREFCEISSYHPRVFLTGHTDLWSSTVSIPDYFLMDGVAYQSTGIPADKDKNAYAIQLNDRDNTKDMLLIVDLKRAAAKIKIVINGKKRNPAGSENQYDSYVVFSGMGGNTSLPDGSTAGDLNLDGFYFRELPYSTAMISDSRSSATTHDQHKTMTRNTVKYNGPRFDNTSEGREGDIVITTYAYARDWSKLDAIDKTVVVANIPLVFHECTDVDADGKPLTGLDVDKDGDGTPDAKWIFEDLPANYYQIPISDSKSLVRNGYYELTVEIGIPGGSDPGEPVVLEPISYNVYDWIPKTVTVGNSTESPAFLAVNLEELEIYNTDKDYNSLEFASSKDVTVEVVNYYFVDKFGKKKYGYEVDANGNTVYNSDGSKNRINTDLYVWEQTGTEERTATITKASTGEYDGNYYEYNWDSWGSWNKNNWLTGQGVPSDELSAAREALNDNRSYTYTGTFPVYNDIKAVPDLGMSGKIKIDSPEPQNNTIRYIELLVRNDNGTPDDKTDDITRTVIVKQYPLVYITNIVGWYSYRDDFKGNGQSTPTTYESYSRNNRVTGIAYSGGNYYYYPTNDNYTRFFRSKVVSDQTDDSGRHYMSYYYVNSSGERTTSGYGYQNARMYHVRITSSSNLYVLGAPRLTADGYTAPDVDNANMISPSFMIASRLGFFNTGDHINDVMANENTGLPLVRDHCKNYVEVYEERDDNGNKTGKKYVLDDWRLPTTKELQIIMDLQGSSGANADAIDFLLNAYYYYSASGRVSNSKGNSSGTSVRCVRDAFDTKR